MNKPFLVLLLSILVGVSFTEGCAGPRHRDHGGAASLRVPPQRPLSADADLFDGVVAVHVALSSPAFVPHSGDEDGPPREGGGGSRGGGDDQPHRRRSRSRGEDDDEGAHRSPGGYVPRPSPARQAMRVSFTNKSAQPVVFTVVEIKSLLANFAPRPERLALAPGQSADLDEMRSAAEENYDELDVTVTVRRGTQNETKVLSLVPPAALP